MESSKKLSKEDRIAVRAARVQAKRAKDDPRSASQLKDKSADDAEDAARNMISKVAITASRLTVDEAKAQAENDITDVQMERQHAESKRRRKEAALREERYARLERELQESQIINAEIESKWDAVAQESIPQELYASISAQYKKASALLAQKDDLIKYLQIQLRQGDEEYVELLSQHQEDINAILKRLSSNFASFLATIKRELGSIEETFLKERSALLEQNREEIDALFEKRRKLELVILESKQQREKKFAAELLEIRSRDAEDYNSLKIDLETSIQIFEQQLEEMRATYQLNSEKLEYNHSVLIERDLENKTTVEHHRQRLRRLKESLSSLITRFHKQDSKFKSENNQLTEEYKRATEAFKDLQRKYAHFVTVDTRKYAEVWSMNENHVMQLVHKLMKADQIIHEQVLGVQWVPPLARADVDKVTTTIGGAEGGERVVDVEAITSAQIFMAGQNAAAALATQQAQAAQQAAAAAAAAGATSPDLTSTSKSSASADAKPSPSSAAAAAVAASAAASAAGPPGPGGSRFTPGQVKTVLDLLVSEVNFLLDSRIQETVAAIGEKNGTGPLGAAAEKDREAEMYQADGIMAAIGVEDREDLDSLVALFFEGQGGAGAAAGGEAGNTSGSASAGGSAPAGDRTLVHPNDVSKLIKEFVLKRQAVKTKGGGAGAGGGSVLAGLLASAAGANGAGGAGGGGLLGGKHHDNVLAEKKARRKERERLFWYRLGHVVSSHTTGVWDALERWQHQYNTLLEDRATLIDETTELAKQNEELKILLQEYLASKVNQELEIPPTRLIRVNNQQR